MLGKLIVLAALAAYGDAEYRAAYADAMRACVSLAPQNVRDLGNDPDEVAYWFKKARFDASKKFWTPAGRRWLLNHHEDRAAGSIEEACAVQLDEEAKKEREVEASYPHH